MIAQFLNESFLLSAADDTRKEMKKFLGNRRRGGGSDSGPLAGVTDEQIEEVIGELEAATRRVSREGGHAKNASICMPHEPILAILQTELTRVSTEQHPEELVADTEGPVDQQIAEDRATRNSQGRRAFGRFEITRPRILSDPRWLWSGVVIAWNRFKNKAPFGGLPSEPVVIADTARLLLVGDWGSGLPRAQAVADRMREVLDDGLTEHREQHVVHLGDVYYTGAEQEYSEHFLPYWPVRAGEDIGSYLLAGNHDMYQGGHAYYGTALADARFSRQSSRSVFALSNSHWQILGLDTATEDKQLGNAQVNWINERLAASPDARTMLLSHHQLFSCYEDAGADLRVELQDVLAAGQIDAWFWGHEHRCLVYEPSHGVAFPSCLGNGGVPEYLVAHEGDPLPAGLKYDYRRKYGNGIEPWNTFGFAVIDFDGPEATVKFIDEWGTEHYTAELA